VKVSGERSFAAPRTAVWHVLNDPASMAKTMPGVESFDVHDEKRWTANVKIPLSLGGLKMSVDMEKTEEREPEFARLAIKGNGVGAMLSMNTAFNLSDAEGGTRMEWEAEVRIAGPVGSMGQRVLQPIVNQQVQHVLAALDKQVQAAESGESAQATSEPGDSAGDSSGLAGTKPPSTEVPAPPASDLKDYGPPAETTPEADPPMGTSGAEEGVAPWAPEAYEPKPEGPTTSTET
jgi:carbon monoxide dehydrogenase subunit G